jgi:hypothetical protein
MSDRSDGGCGKLWEGRVEVATAKPRRLTLLTQTYSLMFGVMKRH